MLSHPRSLRRRGSLLRPRRRLRLISRSGGRALAKSPQWAWRPPVPVAEQHHQRGYEQGADNGGVDQHHERGAEAELLDEDQLRGREGADSDGEQKRRGRDDPPGALEADRHGAMLGMPLSYASLIRESSITL